MTFLLETFFSSEESLALNHLLMKLPVKCFTENANALRKLSLAMINGHTENEDGSCTFHEEYSNDELAELLILVEDIEDENGDLDSLEPIEKVCLLKLLLAIQTTCINTIAECEDEDGCFDCC